jgi:hypothetical protein
MAIARPSLLPSFETRASFDKPDEVLIILDAQSNDLDRHLKADELFLTPRIMSV